MICRRTLHSSAVWHLQTNASGWGTDRRTAKKYTAISTSQDPQLENNMRNVYMLLARPIPHEESEDEGTRLHDESMSKGEMGLTKWPFWGEVRRYTRDTYRKINEMND